MLFVAHTRIGYRRCLLCAAATWVMLSGPVAFANPEGGVVSAGEAKIVTNANGVDILQQSERVVIDWRNFDIAAHERTEFHQPSSNSIALNRIHSEQASQINGTLKANGNVVLINQNGVTFGDTAQVDVNGLVASSSDVENSRFMNEDKPRLDKPGAPNARITNRGRIRAKENGLVGFVAPEVENSGEIQARLGRVTLASGDQATIDFYGDGLLEVAVSEQAEKQLVRNTGNVTADGGVITLTAAAGEKLLASAIEAEGTLRAQRVQQRGGEIIIAADGRHAVANNQATLKNTSPTQSRVTVAATVDVRGNDSGQKGGNITVTADEIAVKPQARLQADGAAGGGRVRVGGEYLGQGNTPVARNVSVAQGSHISADATEQGDGGEVIVFAKNTTSYDGLITANAAGANGRGGFVETSGIAQLNINSGTVEARGSGGGAAGQWLLDPADITITAATNNNITGTPPYTATGTGSQLSAATLVGVLNGGTNVTVQTTNDAFAGNGDIFVNSAITTTGTGALTLSAFRNIEVTSAITLNGGALVLRSNNTGAASGGAIRTTAALVTNGGNITLSGGLAAPTNATYNGAGQVTVAATGYAQGINLVNFFSGVSIGANINAGGAAAGGNIIINGRGENGTNTSHGIDFTAGTISTNFNGTIDMSGIGQGTAGNANQVHGAAIRSLVSTANGALRINGTSGGGTGVTNVGVLLSSGGAGGIVRSTGTGAITLSGTAGANTAAAYGVLSNFNNGINPTGAGAVTIFGSGGTGTSGQKVGIGISQGTTGSLVANGGTISLTGQGGTASTSINNYGIALTGGGAGAGILSNTGGGTITLTGTGGGGAGSTGNHGVYITGTNATVSSSGSGLITINGTGGTGTGGTNHGVYSNIANGIRNSGTGSITVNGTAGTTSGFAFITDVANGVRTSGTAGNITISANSISLNQASNINSVGTVTIGPRTAVSMGVGAGSSTLQFIDTQIGYLTAGTGYIFGNTTATGLIADTAFNFAGRALTYISNANIDLNSTLNGTLTSLTTTAANGTTTVAAAIGGTTPIGPMTMTGRDLAINANVSSSGNISAAYSRDITVASGVTVTTGNASSLTMTAAGNNPANLGNLTLNNAVLRVGTGGLTLTSGINGTRPSWTADATNLVRLGATFGAVSIQGFQDTFINRDINSSSNITMLGFRDLTLNAANTITTGVGSSLSLRSANGITANTGALLLNGNLSVGTGNLTLLSGINVTRPTYTATTSNLVRQGATFGAIDVQGFGNFTSNRILNSTGTVNFSNNTLTTLLANVTSTTGAISFLNPLTIGEAANVTVSSTNQPITFSGAINDTAGGVGESLTVNPGTSSATFNSTADGVALSVTAGTASINGSMGITNALGNTSISTTNTLNVASSMRANSLSLQTTGGGSNINLAGGLEATGAGSALSVVANGQLLKTGTGNITSNNGAITLTAGTYNHLAGNFSILSNGGTVNLNGPNGVVVSGNTGIITNNGNLNINAPLILGASLTATLGTGTLTLGSTVNALSPIAAPISVLAVGGGGGGGGRDAAVNGAGGGSGGAVDVAFNATPGQLYTVLVGGGGGGGISSATSTGGGTAGANGGGAGGNAGSGGNSGGGGGGGGASSVYIGATPIAVAGGGAGGGGGNEGTANDVASPGGGSQPNGNTGVATGGNGANFAGDGGGGGGGGGGYFGGNGQIGVTTSGQASGGATYSNPSNISATVSNGNPGLSVGSGSTPGAAVTLAGPRATFYNYTSNGAGGTAVGAGAAGSNGIVVVRFTGTIGQIINNGGVVSTSGADTLLTYNTLTGTNSFQPLAGCSGSCNFTVSANSVNYGGAIGTLNAPDNVDITTIAATSLPQITAGSVDVEVTGAGNTLSLANAIVANRAAGILSLVSSDGNLAISTGALTSNNGAITLSGADGVTVSNPLQVNSGTASTAISATDSNISINNTLTLAGDTSIAAGTGTVAFAGAVDAAPATNPDLTVTAGTITYGAALGSGQAFDQLSLTSANSQTLPNLRAANIFARTTGASADMTLAPSTTLTASGSGNAITLAAGRHFINNSGAGALALTGAGRWLIYSFNPGGSNANGLSHDFRRFSCSFSAPGTCAYNATVDQTVTFPASGNGWLYQNTPTITITPSALTAISYGTATPSLTGYAYNTITSAQYLSVADFTADTVTGSLNGTTSYAPGPVSGNVGSYEVNYSSGALYSALGYGFSYANNSTAISVNQRLLTVALTGAVSKLYDGGLTATLTGSNYTLGNVYNSEALSITNTLGSYDTRNVGTGKTVTVNSLTLAGATAANYSLASSVNGTIGEITPAALTISAAGINRVYDGGTTATVNLSDNRISGDTLTLGYGSASFLDKLVGTGKAVSVSGITLGGSDAGNYTFNTTASTTANITPATLTISAAGINRVYDGSTTATVNLSDNRISGDILTLGYGSASFLDKLVGTGKAVSVSGITLGGADASNYTFNTTAATTANITPAALTISAAGINRIFDGTTNATVTLIDDRISGDTLTLTYSNAEFDTPAVGANKTVTVTGINVSGIDSGNYTFNTGAITFADILSTAPAIPPIADLPNTVVKVAHNNDAVVLSVAGDDIFASPTLTSTLVYLPAATKTDSEENLTE